MIRLFQKQDLDQAAQTLVDTYAQPPWSETWSLALARTRLEELMSGPMSLGYICEQAGVIVGVLCGRRTTYLCGKEYFIDEFYVAPTAQRQGIGSRMLAYAKADLMSQGFADMVLNTERGFPSESFYKKNGFQPKESLIFMYWDFE